MKNSHNKEICIRAVSFTSFGGHEICFASGKVKDMCIGITFAFDPYLSTIPFGSINPESRIFLRFRSGASTRSLVSFYDSVREHQPRVSYFLFLRFHLRNVTIFRIKSEKKKSVVLDKMCVFYLYPIPDSQQCVKRGSCRRLILSRLLCLYLFIFIFIFGIFFVFVIC